MNKAILVMVLFMAANSAFAAKIDIGVVISVDEKGFTIKPDVVGANLTMTFDPDMGKKHNVWVPRGSPLGATPDQIKVGMWVCVMCAKEKGVFVCKQVFIYPVDPGQREVDFSTMQAKEKKPLPKFVLRLHIQSRCEGGGPRSYVRNFSYKEGVPLKEVKSDFERVLSAQDWKIKELDEVRFRVESYKEEPIIFFKLTAEGLPKDQQPRVKRLDPSKDPSK